MNARGGDLALFLHNHLPFVRHPEHEYFLEEHWLFEAVTECYLPFLQRFYRLTADGVPWRLTCSLTPTLCSMLDDPLLRAKTVRYLDRSVELAEKELVRTRNEPAFHRLAGFYRERLLGVRAFLEGELGGSVLAGYRALADTGNLEIAACAATHGFLPLLAVHPPSVEAQVAVGVATHRRLLGRDPAGFMLPECAWSDGLDKTLARHGVRYCLLESQGVLFADPAPRWGVFAPLHCGRVAAFGRDPESGRQVWSATDGYPGDPVYRDFYRDVGYDREFPDIAPYINPDGYRSFTGIKYHRITGSTPHKEPWDPEAALARAGEHAGNFLFNRERQAEHLAGAFGRRPVIVSPYDGELFGHWWFEGPDFLEAFFRRRHSAGSPLRPVTLGQALEEEPQQARQEGVPDPSSWGDQGWYEVWLNGSNDWVWRHVHHASARMSELVRENPRARGVRARVLKQMAREVLLLQSSDWPFLMTMGTAAEYAHRRLCDHRARFAALEEMLQEGVREEELAAIEAVDNLFPDIDPGVFR